MTTKLALYNGALLACGERALASLSENIEARRLLDRAWDGGAVDYCLGQGQWRFAKRSVEIASSAGITPGFGYAKAFDKPTDHLRTIAMCSDEYMQAPLLRYAEEGAYYFADTDPIYLSYVSSNASYGGDYTLWPADFVEYVQLYLATKIIKKLNQSAEDMKTLFSLAKKALTDARSSNAMEGPTVFAPVGAWVASRMRGNVTRRDRGSRSSLVG